MLVFEAIMAFACFGAVFALLAAAVVLIGVVLWRSLLGLARLVGLAERPPPPQRGQRSTEHLRSPSWEM